MFASGSNGRTPLLDWLERLNPIANFVLLNPLAIRRMGFEQFIAAPVFTLTILFGSFLIVVNVYAWPLLVTLDQPLHSLLKNGLRLAVVHPFWGVLVAIIVIVLLLVSLLLPRVTFLTISFASAALITYWGAWRIIQRYLGEDELNMLGMEQTEQAEEVVGDEQT